MPLLAANRLARWAPRLNQFDYTIEYQKTANHGNADALSCLPSGGDINFNREESGEDMDMVCAIKVLSLHIQPVDANILCQESQKDPVISTVMRYVREGWPSKNSETNDKVNKFRKLSDSLSTCHRCLIHGSRVVIPQSLQSKVLDLLHLGHFGMERIKQLARTAVYWPGIDAAIEMASRWCDSCGEHQNKPSKPSVHHGCYQKSLGVACTWITQSTSWVKIGWWSRMLTPSIHAFIQRHPHPQELL